MKKFKNSIFILFTLFSVTIVITSCTKDDQANNEVSENAKISSYLKSFYSKDVKLGTSLDFKIKPEASLNARTAEFEDLVVTEVFVGTETRARGYVLTNKTTNVFLYFVDVDRIEYKTTKVDIEGNETQIVENIEQLNEYLTTNEFDLIKVTQDMIDQGNSQVGALGRIRYSYGACKDGRRGVYQATFFLGIQWTEWTGVLNDNGIGHVTVGCNEKYYKDLSAD